MFRKTRQTIRTRVMPIKDHFSRTTHVRLFVSGDYMWEDSRQGLHQYDNSIIDVIDCDFHVVPRIGERIIGIDLNGTHFYDFTVTDVRHSISYEDVEICITAASYTFFGHVKNGLDWRSATPADRAFWRECDKNKL